MKKKNRNIFLAVIAGSIGLVAAWFLTRPPKALYETEPVSRATVMQTVSVTGELVPGTYADLSFQRVGTVRSVLVGRGDTVSAGQTIAVLDSSTLEAELRSAEIALDIAVQDEDLARRGRIVRWEDLAPEEREKKKLASEQARQAVRSVLTRMAQDRITAPVDGTVSRLNIREGETVMAGNPVARISASSDILLESRVPEADILKLKTGMAASVTFDAFTKDDIFSATVSEIEPSSTVVQDVVSYVTRFVLADDDPRLREGMSATIDAVTAEAISVLVVPFRAVIREGDAAFVELSRDGITAERRGVTLGLEGDEGMIEVKSGLSEGDPVVVSTLK